MSCGRRSRDQVHRDCLASACFHPSSYCDRRGAEARRALRTNDGLEFPGNFTKPWMRTVVAECIAHDRIDDPDRRRGIGTE